MPGGCTCVEMEISGKSAVVTGGANGIGLAIAEQLLAQGVKKIALLDILQEENEEISSLRRNHPDALIEFLSVDVTEMKSFREIFHEITEKFVKIDIVVNCAGIFDECDYARMFNVNVCGVINSTMLAIEHMRQDGGGCGGSVLNISSIAALNPVLAAPLYSATKQAVLTITTSLADDFFFSRFGIFFHTLCPGATATRFFTDSFDARCLFPDFASEYHAAMAKYPIQEVAAVATAAVGMLKDHRNGSVLIVNDGKVEIKQ
uniref:15-hydroxyprostaglandin dehydrogenase n=1 Tax=Lutzomyia longipalpis TaxID=7200 RepID=A0A1B0CE72_LUTLO